jgi:hypothetical protein
MATSTLIQFLDSGEAGDTSNRRQVETFIAGGAIAEGDWVALDNSQTGADRALYVVEAAGVATKGNAAAMGVALADAAANERIDIVVSGYVAKAGVAAATVAGDALIGPIGTAGRAEIEVPGTTTGAVCGIALEADTANFAAVMVVKRY